MPRRSPWKGTATLCQWYITTHYAQGTLDEEDWHAKHWHLRRFPAVQIPEDAKEIVKERHGYSTADAPKLNRGSMRMHATGCFLLQDMGGGRTFMR